MKRAFITGVAGQDGSYLAELLLGKGYEVHGLVRRTSVLARPRIDHLHMDDHPDRERFLLHYGDVTDGSQMVGLLRRIAPDEVYHLAAQSHVRVSFDEPVFTVQVDALGTLNVLEAVRQLERPVRFYQASSSEMFGLASAPLQDERTPFHPRSPYACAKAFSHFQTVNYREAYGLFACSGILFNHESPRRGEAFVTRKIARAAARIKAGLERKLYLGNLDARRDWGFAGDYVDAMWRMLQQDEPGDFVVATGVSHSVRDFLDAAFSHVGLDWHDYVATDERLVRPAEVDALCGDASRAREQLGWTPVHDFHGLVRMMVDAELAEARRS